MILIDNNNITLIKGNTAYLSITLEGDYSYQEGDILTLTVRKNIDDKDVALTKTIAANENFEFAPEDTKAAAAGRYVYDVQLTTVDNDVFTVVAPSDFVLKEAVTRE